MKSLYIIGNGFDLDHGLDTRYQSFAKFLAQSDSEIYDLLIVNYGLPDISEDPVDDEDYAAWSTFELALADLDYEQVLHDNSNLMANPGSDDFRDRDWHAYQIEMELIIEKLTSRLISMFNKFIFNVKYPSKIDRKTNIILDSLFLNFNYTYTLEKYYNIDQKKICYIHGKSTENDCEIILGHGTDPSNFEPEKPQPPQGASEEEMDQWRENMAEEYDYSYDSAKTEILSYFEAAFKDTLSIIEDKINFFESLRNIENIYVLGHSISSVDIKYFEAVRQYATQEAKWYVTYYNDDEKPKHIEALTGIGINTENIVQLRLSEL